MQEFATAMNNMCNKHSLFLGATWELNASNSGLEEGLADWGGLAGPWEGLVGQQEGGWAGSG